MTTYTSDIVPQFGLPWPGYQEKDYTKLPADELMRDYEQRKKIEDLAKIDPVQFGWTLPGWREVMDNWQKYSTHVVLGGNRASKSAFVARLCVFLLEAIPECRIRVFHVSSSKSITEQQSFIWEALPKKYKDLSGKKSGTYSTTFSQRNGFTGDKLILPPKEGFTRGSEIIFGTYSQWKNDPQVVEGWWAHFIWCDEECPQKMFERLLTRVYDVRGRVLLSFTTIQGWTGLVADILGKTKILRRRFAQLLKRDIKVAEESLTRNGTRIYYFWTEDNPFIPPETIERMRGRPEAEILAVAYGIPTRSATTKFPKFKEEVHVIKHEKLPWNIESTSEDYRKLSDFTVYHVVDPSGAKPWSMIWAAVDKDGSIYVYRDWPDLSYGNWGEVSEKTDGSPGQAMKPNGWGIYDYCDAIRSLEDEDKAEPFERIMDPRLGAARVQGKESATSIMSEMEVEGFVFMAAPGLDIDHGISLINDRFGYNEEKPVDAVNRPKMYISSNCENLIECIKNYTGSGRLEVCKDFIDTLRYLLEAGADYIPKSAQQDTGSTWSY